MSDEVYRQAELLAQQCHRSVSEILVKTLENFLLPTAKPVSALSDPEVIAPIENFWSKVKSLLRTLGARTYKELSSAINLAYEQVEEQDFWNWFPHCCYCTSST